MKKRQIVLYVVVMLVLLTTSVYATIRAELSFKLTADDSIFYPGEEFILTIGLKDLEATQGIKSIEGYIDIDENVLEPLTVDSIVKDENGKVTIGTNNVLDVYDASNISSATEKGVILNTNPVSERGDYKIVINLENPVSTDTDLVDITFKIRSDVAAGEYSPVMSYQLFKIFSTDAGEKLELPQVSYRIQISDPSEARNEVNTTNNTSSEPANNVPTNTPSNNPTNNATRPVNNTPTNNPTNNTARPVNNTPVNNAARPVNNTPANNTAKPVNNSAKPVNNTPKNNTVNNVVNKNANKASGSGSGSGTGTGTTTGKDNTLAPTNLPKTGYRLMLIPIIAMAIVGFVFYKKYSKYNNYHE